MFTGLNLYLHFTIILDTLNNWIDNVLKKIKSLTITFFLVSCIMFQVYALLSDFCILSKTWSYMIMRNKTKALNPWNLIHFELVKRKICKSHLSIKELFNTYTTPPNDFSFLSLLHCEPLKMFTYVSLSSLLPPCMWSYFSWKKCLC